MHVTQKPNNITMIQAKSHLPRSEQCNSQHALNGDKTAGFVV